MGMNRVMIPIKMMQYAELCSVNLCHEYSAHDYRVLPNPPDLPPSNIALLLRPATPFTSKSTLDRPIVVRRLA